MKQDRERPATVVVTRIVLLYAFFSALWIYCSDTVLETYIHDPHLITRLSIYKGFLFILITSALLFVLFFRHARRMAETTRLLREREDQLRFSVHSIEHTTDAVYWITADGRFRDCNRAACSMLGYSREELLSLSVLDIDPDYASENIHSHLAELRESGSKTFRRHHTRRDGSTIPVEISTNHFMYDDQEYLCSIVRDISDRVQAEKDAAFFRALIECTHEPVYALDMQDGCRMVYANPAACRHFGVDLQTLTTWRIPDWDPVFDMERRAEILEEQRRGKLLRFETLHRVASGELIPVEVSANTLQHDGREYSAGNFHDIRERKAMETTIRESERNLIEAQRIARVGNWSRDLEGNLLYASAECRRIHGKEVEQLTGRFDSFLELIHPDDRQRIEAAFRAIVRTGQPFQSDFTIIRPNGTEVMVRAQGEMVRDESGKPLRVVGTVQDITEQRRAEADRIELERQMLNLQRLESLGVLAGGIAHNFNNVLTGVMGYISYARMFLDPSTKSHGALENAEEACRRASGMANQLLTFARGGEPIKRLLSVRRLVDECLSLALNNTTVRRVMEISPELHSVMADESQLAQAFNNIIVNAAQAMEQGGTLTVRGGNVRLPRGEGAGALSQPYVSISFSDEGEGIPATVLPKIFDPYFTTKSTGTGLGLASAHSIVTRHGGMITVDSQVGRGASFTVLLPSMGEALLPAQDAGRRLKSGGQGGGRVLVMDHEENIREFARESLLFLGYRVACCGDGRDAVRLYCQADEEGDPFFAAILDLTVPGGMGGTEAAHLILKQDPAARLIVSSGYSYDPIMSGYREHGFCAAVSKPYKVDQLGQELGFLREGGGDGCCHQGREPSPG